MDTDSADLSSPPDDSVSIPSDSVIEKALCDTVVACYKSKDLDSLTLKRVRNTVTEKLNLPEDFLKTDPRWKNKSKEVVNDEVARQDSKSSQPSSSPIAPKKRAPPAKSAPAAKAKKVEKLKPATKRKSTESKAPVKKRRKITPSSESDIDDDDDDDLSTPPESDVNSAGSADSEEEIKKPTTKPSTKAKPAPIPPAPSREADLSDSDLSSVIDIDPPPKSKRQKSTTNTDKSEKSTKAKPASKSKPATKDPATPQEEEIKRLQGWLVKCGIRKLWHKELASYSTPREKISHLKAMLEDAGMGSRYSEEKARAIKDERELKADLEDIVERERKWGQSGDEDEDEEGDVKAGGAGRPKRKLARGLKELQVFAEDEESSG